MQRYRELKLDTDTMPIVRISDPFGRKTDSDLQLYTESQIMGKLCVEQLFINKFSKIHVTSSSTSKVLGAVEREVKRCLKSKEMRTTEPFRLDTMQKVPPLEPEGVALHFKTTAYVLSSSLGLHI